MTTSGLGTTERLLEREVELESIAAAVDAATAGRGGFLLVEGPAGIGKTRLLDAARASAAAHGMAELAARGGELERHIAFGVVRQLYERAVGDADPAGREQLLGGAARLAEPVLDLATDADPGGEAEARTLHGLYWLTANLVARSPAIAIIDDLHWTDAASLRFLVYLGRRVGELSLLIVAARRPAEAATAAVDLHEMLESEATTAKLEPRPLTPAATGSLLSELVGDDPDPELVVALHEAAGGNPFLLREVVAAMRGADLPLDARSARRIGEVMPRGVSRQIVMRLGRLPAEASALARAVAILGTDAEPRHAAALADLRPEEAASAADLLAVAAILRPGTPYEFVHPLVRSAIYADQPEGDRATAHREAARLLSAENADPTAVAIHWLAVPPAAEVDAVVTLRAAGELSLRRGTPAEAAEYLRRALAEPPPGAEREGLLATLGRAELQSGQPDEGVTHLEQAMEASSDARERSGMAHDLATGLIAPGRYVEAVAMLQRAVSEAEAVDEDLARSLDAELITAALMVHETTPVRDDRVERLPHDVPGDTRGERALLVIMAMDRMIAGDPVEDAAELARRAVRGGLIAEQGGHSGMWLNAHYVLAGADEVEFLDRAVEAAFADVRARGSVIGVARNACFLAITLLRRGSVAEAESYARQSIEVGREPGYRVAGMAVAPLVEALIERGELKAADEALREAGFDDQIPDIFMLNFVLFARARLHLAAGRTAEAVADLEEFANREQDWRRDSPACFPWRSVLAQARARLGDADRAAALASDELELARRQGSDSATGMALRALGLALGRDGIDALRESVEVLAPTPARAEQARSQVELGAALRRAGERAAAREPLRSGMELAHVCGATALVERAREELVATGARPRRVMRTGVDALTPSELRVARMAAEGMTNREIAEALFVTLRTVEVHLTHTYQKLEIASRQELIPALEAS